MNNSQTFSEKIDVIVIGAGMAGIMTAYQLNQKGLKVLILEGRERIGGRIWTDNRWNIPLDLGAAWIHGNQGNPLSKLVHDFQIDTVDFDFEDAIIYAANGQEIPEHKISHYESLFDELSDDIERIRQNRKNQNKTDISVQAAINEILKDEDLTQEQTQVLNSFLNYFELEYAADLDNLSLYYWDEGKDFGSENLIFTQGYQQLLTPLAKDLNIKLNHQVKKVEYNQNIQVTTNQGIFESKYAVITLPLGVLKSGKVEFLPILPQEKQQAIQRLGMGVVNKLFLKFPEVFWEDTQMLNYVAKNKGEWGAWVNFDSIINKPILLGFYAGSYDAKLQQYSDAQIVKEAMQVLTTIYGDIPHPVDSIITRWHQDPYSLGSYSYIKPGATPEDYERLAKPVNNKLFFAGEATSKDYSATVHGALLSGKRAAQEILSIF